MESIYEGGADDKNAAGPLTDRPVEAEEQLAEKDDAPAESLEKPQDESNVVALD